MRVNHWLRRHLYWLLPTVLIALAISYVIVAIVLCIKIESTINLNDILANILSVVTLYVTVIIVFQLTNFINKKTKEEEVEKAIIIEIIKDNYSRIVELGNQIETGTVSYDETNLSLGRIKKEFNRIQEVYTLSTSINLQANLITDFKADFIESYSNLKDTLTSTPAGSGNPTSSNYVQIISGQISINTQGIALAIIEIDKLKNLLTKMILQVNKITIP